MITRSYSIRYAILFLLTAIPLNLTLPGILFLAPLIGDAVANGGVIFTLKRRRVVAYPIKVVLSFISVFVVAPAYWTRSPSPNDEAGVLTIAWIISMWHCGLLLLTTHETWYKAVTTGIDRLIKRDAS